ncbi:MAG: radical SAM protein [Oligoflexia bacterium]|nr:radical SAM protein [Oligoflexia bacterium]
MTQLTQFQQVTRIAQALVRSRLSRRHPVVLLHAVTEACNARCPYCVFRHGKRGPAELDLDAIDDLYGQAVGVGVQYVHLWGGEPLVHPRIGDITMLAKQHGLIVGMVTNGMLLQRRLDEVLPRLDRLYVSLDHPSPHHDQMRRTRGLYRRALAGIDAARAARPDLFVLVSFTLCRDNADQVEAMAQLCADRGLRLYVNPMRAASNAAGDAPAARNDDVFDVDNVDRVIPWSDQVPIWQQLIALKKQGLPIQNSMAYMRQIVRRADQPRYRCHWPKIAVSLDANGDVVDCQRWDRPLGNLRDASLRDLLDSPRARALCGPQGEHCNTCISPARFEPSGVWGMKPALIAHAMRGFGGSNDGVGGG